MSLFGDIRTGLANRLSTINGLRVTTFIPDNVNPPVAIVGPVSIQYDAAFNRGHDDLLWDVVVIVGRADEKSAQDLLDCYCDPMDTGGVKYAIERDITLGGKVINTRVTDMTSYQTLAVGEVQYLAATFLLSIIAN